MIQKFLQKVGIIAQGCWAQDVTVYGKFEYQVSQFLDGFFKLIPYTINSHAVVDFWVLLYNQTIWFRMMLGKKANTKMYGSNYT